MPNAQTQRDKIRGIVALDDNVHLSGELSLLLDGTLALDGTAAPESAVPGAVATLTIAPEQNHQASLSEIRVRIAQINHHGVTLEFASDRADLAKRYRELLSQGTSVNAELDTGGQSRAVFTSKDPGGGSGGNTLHHPSLQESKSLRVERDRPRVAAVTAEYSRMLDWLQTQSSKLLQKALKPFLQDLTRHLLDQASQLGQGSQPKNANSEAYALLKQNGEKLQQCFGHELDEFFADLVPEEEDDQLWDQHEEDDGIAKLDLVDLNTYDEFLLIERIVTQGEETHHVALEALTIRIARLVDVDPITLRNPLHVRQLCRAFQRSLVASEIPAAVQPGIFEYFNSQFLSQLQHFYAPLNETLAQHNIEPSIEDEIRDKGSLLQGKTAAPPERTQHGSAAPAANEDALPEAAEQVPHVNPDDAHYGAAPLGSSPYTDRRQPSAAAGAAGNTAQDAPQRSDMDKFHQQLGEQLTGAMGHFTPASLYKSVVDAMNFKREAEGRLDSETLARGDSLSGTWDGDTVPSTQIDQNLVADAQAIARALGEIQRSSEARREVMQSNSLRAYLAQNRESMGGLHGSSGLTAESLNQLDMVDNLFETIRSQLDVSEDLKPTLGNLQIPLAKLALMDPRFFVDHGHSARAVVDKLSQLAASANFPNRALETRIGGIVDNIIADYETDTAVFDDALVKIEQLVAQQERALSKNIERVVKTQEGQEKLSQARRAVSTLIRDVVPTEDTPKPLIDLIESGLRDLLVLTHVKQGADSEAWEEQVRHLELLSRWLKEQQQGGIEDETSVERSLEATSLLELVGQQITAALPTNISHESVLAELRDVFAGSADIKTTDAGDTLERVEPEPEQLRAKIEDLPRLRRWVKRVEQLEKDQWLAYRDKEGNKKRMQLAWISPARDRYIFVNERGQKVADLSAIRLARQLSRGVQPPAPADKLSVVDKSMYSTLEHVQKTLSFARNHDSLTKLINRETFLDQMQRALRHAQTRRSEHAVLYINIDQFELVNEVYDRISGDQVLMEFAKLLSQLHSKKSSSARIKGDEFAVLLIDRPLEVAMQAAEKIRADIEASSIDIEGENVSFTVSIGVASVHEHNESVEKLLKSARAAMQLAKQSGRNQVVQFEEDQTEATEYQAAKNVSRQNLEEALATDRFVLRAQPIVQTSVTDRENTTLHYELLLGLTTKEGDLASPEEFINSAERYGFMTLVDRWVVREAFSWISALMDQQKVVPSLSINLSGASVTDDAFLDYLLEQISEFGVGTSRLCFEITEAGTISNLVKAADFVSAFRNIGCKFSIDDFGTGLASHNYLRELPVDYVKIDGSFVIGIHENRNDYAMARSINDLAHFLGQETIAESVENDEIVGKLEEIGVDYLQGWGIGKPKLLTDVAQDLSTIEK